MATNDYRIEVTADTDAQGFTVLCQGEDVIVVSPQQLAELIERLRKEEREVAFWEAAS